MKKATLNIVALILAISPIIDPYIFIQINSNTIRVMDVIVIIAAGLLFFKTRKIKINRPLFVLLILFSFLTLISFFFTDQYRQITLAFKILTIWFIYFMFVCLLWEFMDRDKFATYTLRVAYISITLLILQFIFVNLGHINFFDGRIPVLKLSRYDGWAPLLDPSTGDIRVHSFFQEPSYVTIYLLPIFSFCLNERKYYSALYIVIGLIITTSSIGVFGIVLISGVYLLNLKNTSGKRQYIKILGFICVSVCFMFILYNSFAHMKTTMDYSLHKITNIQNDLKSERFGSTKLRLVGNYNYFNKYPIYLKLVGAGAGQYTNYFHYNNVISYSSNIVTIMLNFGIIGLVIFSIWILNLRRNITKKSRNYLYILLLLCFTDQMWFNWYFFYLLTWVFINSSFYDKTIS